MSDEVTPSTDIIVEPEDEKKPPTEAEMIENYVAVSYEERNQRRCDLQETICDIQSLVEKFKNAQYDLGMVAGRQMSTTSGEFIVQSIEKEIMDYIDEQIGILPDPDLKKKKAKPEEVAMIRELLEEFLDENMDLIVREVEAVEEEEEPIPEIIVVYAVPGIGPPVEEEIVREFEEYAMETCKLQAEVFMPRNIRHFLCPPLEKYIEHVYEDDIVVPKKREEVATGGALTD